MIEIDLKSARLLRRLTKERIELPFITDVVLHYDYGDSVQEGYQLYLTPNNKFIWKFSEYCEGEEVKSRLFSRIRKDIVFEDVRTEWVIDINNAIKEELDRQVRWAENRAQKLEAEKQKAIFKPRPFTKEELNRNTRMGFSGTAPMFRYKNLTKAEIEKNLFMASLLRKTVDKIKQQINK